MNSIYFTICCLIFSSFLTIVYFSKKRSKNIDNYIYPKLLIINIAAMVAEILCYILVVSGNIYLYNLLYAFLLKIMLILVDLWVLLYLVYYIIILKNKTNVDNGKIYKQLKKIYIYFLVCCITIIILPLEIKNINGLMMPMGAAVYFIYATGFLYLFGIVVTIIINVKKIIDRKIYSLFLFIIFSCIVSIIQCICPELVMINQVISFTTFIMYFTIENPDMKLIEQLNIARDQAEKANQAKSDFLSNMSHEIRTPLNAILGFSQALQEEELSQEAKEEVKDIVSASNSLLDLVNGILDISKIEANKLEIVNTEYSFKKVFNELVSLTKARLGEKPLDFRVLYDDSIPGVLYGDHSRIKQIILNLLTNAIKYTKEGYVEFKVSSVIQGDVCRLIVSVEDSGIGIKNENIDKLFSKFERFDLEKNVTIEGTGLGLAITKKLIELMNGKIVVQSVYGQGSKFTVAIDQKIVAGKEAVVEDDETEVEIFDASDKKILVVDDNKINLKVASRLLLNYNVQVETVESGFECIERIENGNSYDLILMDDMMPKMSGVETFHKLKEKEGFNIPVVALTANAISGMREKYLNEGFNDYLSKPIDKLDLNVVMKKYLRK